MRLSRISVVVAGRKAIVAAVLGTAALLASAASLTAQEASAEAVPTLVGNSARDLVFTPVPRCRVIDTRVEGGRLTAGVPRHFDVAGPLVGQGGASDCLVPYGPATAVVLNLVAVQPQGAGTLTAWPFGGAMPTANVLSYNRRRLTGAGNAPNEVTLAICDPANAGCTYDLTLQANGADTHLVADVAGYFSGVTALTVPWSAVTGKPAGFEDGTDDDTQYSASAGLTQSGTVFSVDTAAIQSRVGGTCTAGSSIRAITANGTVTCEPDDNTTYAAGTGLSLSGTTFSANSSVIQNRVTGSCLAGSSIRAIDSAGAVTCETDSDTDTNTTYAAGSGLTLIGTTFSVNTNAIQDRVTGTCTSAIRTINADGTVACGPTIRAGRDAPGGQAQCPTVTTIAFSSAFSGKPSVVVTPEDTDGTASAPDTYCSINQVSATGFEYCCYGNRPTWVNWIAIR
jgi:hypothetical protein